MTSTFFVASSCKKKHDSLYHPVRASSDSIFTGSSAQDYPDLQQPWPPDHRVAFYLSSTMNTIRGASPSVRRGLLTAFGLPLTTLLLLSVATVPLAMLPGSTSLGSHAACTTTLSLRRIQSLPLTKAGLQRPRNLNSLPGVSL